MKAYVLIETAAGKTKNVKKALAKIKSPRATVAAMDAVTGPYDFIAVVDGQPRHRRHRRDRRHHPDHDLRRGHRRRLGHPRS